MRKGARTAKPEKIEIARRICEAYSSNDFTIESCCKSEGVSWGTFWNWCNDVDEINELYKEAQNEKDRAYKSNLKALARTALEKRVMGYDVDASETITETLNDADGEQLQVLKIKTKTASRHIPADVRAIMFALSNLDATTFPENKVLKIDFDGLTPAEQESILEKLAQKLKDEK